MIRLVVQLDVNGRCKNIEIDSLTRGDFQSGPRHLLTDYFEPMAELVCSAYAELTAEENPTMRDLIDERESISKRLARIGMV